MTTINSTITPDQINKCLFNGNYKLGKLSGGLHSVDNVKNRGLSLPDNLPDNTKNFLFFSGNVILYTAGGKAYYNTGSTGKLTDIQKASLEYIKKTLTGKKIPMVDVDLGWQSTGGGRSVSLDDKISGMF